MHSDKTNTPPDRSPSLGDDAGLIRTATTEDQRRLRGSFIVVAILLIGLLLRGMYLVELLDAPDFHHPTAVDSDYHDEWAWGLASGEWAEKFDAQPHISTAPYFRPPGYAYFLSLLYRAAGHSYVGVRIVQMILGMVTCLLAYRFASRWFGWSVGAILVAMMTTSWVLVFYEGELQAPTLLVFLALVLISMAADWVNRVSIPRCIGAGLVLGLFAVVRPNILLFAPVLLAWLWWVARKRYDRRRLVAAMISLSAGIALAVAPVTIRNYFVGQDRVLISGNGGVQLWVGNHELATGVGDGTIPILWELTRQTGWTSFDYPRIVQGLGDKLGRPVSYSDASKYFARRALAYITRHPFMWIRLTAAKVALFWGPRELDSNKELEYSRDHSPVLRKIPGRFSFAFALAILGLAWILYDWRSGATIGAHDEGNAAGRHRVTVLVVLFVLAYALSFVPFAVTTRYRLPILPFVYLLGAYGLHRMIRLVMMRKLRPAAWCFVGWTILFLLSDTRWVSAEPDEAKWFHDRGTAYMRAGSPHRAEVDYERSLQLNPDDHYTHAGLASALLAQGRVDDAFAQWDKALEVFPRYAEAHTNVGHVLLRMGYVDRAMQRYAAAVALKPTFAAPYHNLANLLAARGDVARAIEYYETALRYSPRSIAVHLGWGGALARSGDFDGAIRHYHQALDVQSTSVEARINLGLALKEKGLLDEAAGQYRKALRLNPSHAIGHHNLAAVLLEQGRIKDAIEAFQTALRLQPDLAHTRHLLGQTLLEADRVEEAIAQLTVALRLEPANIQIGLHLAHAHAATGNLEAAIAQLGEVLKADPDNADARQQLHALRDAATGQP